MSEAPTPKPKETSEKLTTISTRPQLPTTGETPVINAQSSQAEEEFPSNAPQAPELPTSGEAQKPADNAEPTPAEINTEVAKIIDQLNNTQTITQELFDESKDVLESELSRLTTLLASDDETDITKIVASVNKLKQAKLKLKDLEKTMATPEQAAFKKKIAPLVERTLEKKGLDKNDLKDEIIEAIAPNFETIENGPKDVIGFLVVMRINEYLSKRQSTENTPKNPESITAVDRNASNVENADEDTQENPRLKEDAKINTPDKEKTYEFKPDSPDVSDWIFSKDSQKELAKKYKQYRSRLAKEGSVGAINTEGKLTNLGKILNDLSIPVDKGHRSYLEMTGDKSSNIQPNIEKISLLIKIAEILSSVDGITARFSAIPPELKTMTGGKEPTLPDNQKENFSQLITELHESSSLQKMLLQYLNETFFNILDLNQIEEVGDENLYNKAESIVKSLSKDDQKAIKTNKNLQKNISLYFSSLDSRKLISDILAKSLDSFNIFEENLLKALDEISEEDSEQAALLQFYVQDQMLNGI